MKTINGLITTFLFLATVSCGLGTGAPRPEISGNMTVDVISILPSGKLPVDIMTAKANELVSTGKSNIEIIRNEDVITFKAESSLEILNSTTIDLLYNTVTLKENKLNNFKSVNDSTKNNVFKSEWSGYAFLLVEPSDIISSRGINMDAPNLKYYQFTVGRLDKDGSTFILIEGQEKVNGQKIVDLKQTITL
jgi:hypothetical protein